MSRRHIDALTELVVVAISPALIIIMVSSLVFFATHCFYDGSFDARLRIASVLFIFAAVLISRISIDEGREYAMAFAVPLSITTILSLLRYTDAGLIFVLALVAFIWWATDKLTWDCTVLDTKKDASGEGLLQTIGKPGENEHIQEHLDAEATTNRAQTDTTSLWERWLSYRRRHHTPGVWVVYFGLAAIPLFGLGQMLISEHSQGLTFLLLCIYVGSALALLMTTSFLQMRRYLNQRRLPFTDQMAAIWLGAGGTIIVVLMLVALALPRPNTGYSLVDSFAKLGSHDRKASRTSVGKSDAVADDEQSGSGKSEDEQATSDSDEGTQKSKDAEKGQTSGKDGKTKGGSKSQSGKADRRQGKERQGQQDERSQQSNSAKQSPSNNESDDELDKEDSESSAKSSGQQAESNSSSSRSQSLPQLPNISLPSIPRLVYLALIGALMLFVLLRYGREIGTAVGTFLSDLAEMLRRLFGGKPRTTSADLENELETGPTRRPFSSFQDPFATGTVDRFSPQQLVHYSFEALQAWAYERGCTHSDEQTPLEFATQVASTSKQIGKPAKTLASLYNQAAYAPGSLSTEAVDHVRLLWKAFYRS